MLAIVWFALIGVLLTGYAIFDGFDLGIGVLYPFLGKTDADKAVMHRAVGPVWDGNEVWLITAGGALFAAFPAVYATVFSGFYLALMLVLFSLIMRAGSLEFRHADPAWGRFWDATFFVSSLLPSILFGVAAGNIIRGVPLDSAGEYAGSFFTLLNPFALVCGVLGLSWFVLQGSAWLAMKASGDLYERTRRVRGVAVVAFAVLFAVTTAAAALLAPDAFARGLGNPLVWAFVLVGLAGVAMVPLFARNDTLAFAGSSLGALAMVGIWAMSIFPDMVPSLGPGGALTIARSSSSQLTLTTMLIISAIGVPLALLYVFLIYRIDAGRIHAEETGHY